MKVRVKKPFRDIHSKEDYAVGDIIEMTQARFKEATANLKEAGGGFIEKVKEEPKQEDEKEG